MKLINNNNIMVLLACSGIVTKCPLCRYFGEVNLESKNVIRSRIYETNLYTLQELEEKCGDLQRLYEITRTERNKLSAEVQACTEKHVIALIDRGEDSSENSCNKHSSYQKHRYIIIV